jgi:PemK-like protein.
MEEFVKGDVVVVPFPFSNLASIKRRPALVIASLQNSDIILCQITSQDKGDEFAVVVSKSDFDNGGLEKTSYVRPDRIFTAEKSIILYKAGSISNSKSKEVRDIIVDLLDNR